MPIGANLSRLGMYFPEPACPEDVLVGVAGGKGCYQQKSGSAAVARSPRSASANPAAFPGTNPVKPLWGFARMARGGSLSPLEPT